MYTLYSVFTQNLQARAIIQHNEHVFPRQHSVSGRRASSSNHIWPLTWFATNNSILLLSYCLLSVTIIVTTRECLANVDATNTILGKMGEQRKAIFALISCSSAVWSRSRRALFALTSRSDTPGSGERILGAHIALTLRSPRAQMGSQNICSTVA